MSYVSVNLSDLSSNKKTVPTLRSPFSPVFSQDADQALLGQTVGPDAAASTVVAVTSGLGLAPALLASSGLSVAQVSQETKRLLEVTGVLISLEHGVDSLILDYQDSSGAKTFLSTECPSGYYGKDCAKLCSCGEGGQCNPATGRCNCAPGRMGQTCQQGKVMMMTSVNLGLCDDITSYFHSILLCSSFNQSLGVVRLSFLTMSQ